MSADIKIFVSCHKEAQVVKSHCIYPIQVGTALTERRLEGMAFRDDDAADNISHLNKKYCELTAQYFAYKNVEADYYGFFHYRRYLSFSNKHFCRSQYSVKRIDGEFAKKFAINDESITSLVENYDIILPKTLYSFVTNRRQYAMSKAGFVKDLDFCVNVIKRDYPEMLSAAKQYLRKSKSYICNMFIMKKELFKSYCEWLFDILKKFDEGVDCSNYDSAQYRVDGYLSERLLGIYVTWLSQRSEYKIKTLPRVFIKNN